MIAILCSGCMDLYGLDYKHFMSINFENISLLVSSCMDLLANKKCTQVAWTNLDCHEYKVWTYFTLVSGCMDLLANKSVLRFHGPI